MSQQESCSPQKSSGETPEIPCDRYIVGVGASAGGLEALERFFEAVPDDPGASFIVVQHLSPDYESQMKEILGRRTKLPVKKTEDGMELEENTVYLIPPAKTMIVSQGRLLLTEKDSNSLSFPIDVFFRSLATEAQKSSIGVILSGTGSDGTLGCGMIHDAGGLVLAQDENSAKFDGMPVSVVDSGVVDLVLEPEKMPSVIQKFIEKNLTPAVLTENLPPEIPAGALETIFDALHNRFQVDFSQYKASTITRRLQRRIEKNGDQDLDTYAARIMDDAAEVEALYLDLLIGVTQFFRNPEAFESLREKTVEPLVKEENGQIRVWVAGCSTGEEAYSIAILFLEAFRAAGKKPNLKIFASDVHAGSIRIAAEGFYASSALTKVKEEYLQRYFSAQEEGYKVAADLRQAIVFTEHNLIKAVPFTRLHLITCRNLLIYFQPNAQKKVFSFFHFGLRASGYLMLGTSEAISHLEEEFSVIDSHWKIFRKRRDLRLSKEIASSASVTVAGSFASRSPERRSAPDTQLNRIATSWEQRGNDRGILQTYDCLLNHFMPPGVLVDDRFRMIHLFAGGERYLRIRPGRTSQSVLDMVHDDIKASVSSALQHCVKDAKEVRYSGVQHLNDQGKEITIAVTPFPEPSSGELLFCISFIEEGRQEPLRSLPEAEDADVHTYHGMKQELEHELRLTQENLQATIEELETSNEELQATNEELVASNEELQSSNEELHSVNEELDAVNSEHQEKIAALSELNGDIDNMLAATRIGVIFLDEDLIIRKFTPSIATSFRFRNSDIGRLFHSFSHPLQYGALEEDLRRVREDREVIVRALPPHEEKKYQLRIGAYVGEDQEVSGLILSVLDITSAEETEQRVAELSDIVMSSNDAIIGFSASGMITSWNRGAEMLYGYTANQAEGKSALDLIIPESDASSFMIELDSALSGEKPAAQQVARRTRTGALLTVTSRLSTATPSDSNKTQVSSIERDISDDVAVRLERDRLAHLFEITSDFVTIVDGNGHVIYLNSAGKRLIGLPPTFEERKAQVDLFFSREDRKSLEKNTLPIIQKEGVWSGRLVLTHRDGHSVPVSAVIVKQDGRNGATCSFGAIMRDLTEDEAAYTRLAKSEKIASRIADTLSGVIQNFPEMLVVLDERKQVEFISPDAHAFFKTYGERGSFPLQLDELVDECLQTGRSYLPVDFQGVRTQTIEDGSLRAYLVRVTVLKDRNDQTSGAIVTLQDVTEFRLLNELKTGLIGTVSHELKNPVSSLSMSLELVLEKALGPLTSQQETILESAASDCRRITSTITSLLDLARFEEGEMAVPQIETHPSELLQESFEHNRSFAAAADVSLEQSVSSDCPHFNCDYDRTVIVLDNLVSNAMKHSSSGHAITLSARLVEEGMEFSVCDQGPGVPEKHQDEIFAKFFRVPRDKAPGSGLGLNIAREFVQAQGGRIGYRDAEGGGACFYFILPVE